MLHEHRVADPNPDPDCSESPKNQMPAPVAIIIPARYQSSRYPGKPLALLRGAAGEPRSLLARSVAAARQAGEADLLAVATDDERIAAEARRVGAAVVMTSPACRNGTERVAEAAALLGVREGIVINLQGDAPLTPPWFVEALVSAMRADSSVEVATPILRCDEGSLALFLEDRRAGRVGATTVVRAGNCDALYFSKEVIPFTAGRTRVGGVVPVFHHVGLYAYTPRALSAYAGWEPSPLETVEGLEQLRFLEAGWQIRTVEVEGRGRAFWELNNPEDVPRIEAHLREMGVE